MTLGLGILSYIATQIEKSPHAAPLDGVATALVSDVTLDDVPTGERYLRVSFSADALASHMMEAVLVDPSAVGGTAGELHRAVLRPTVWTGFSHQSRLFDHGFAFMEYMVDSPVDLRGPLLAAGVDAVFGAGSPLPIGSRSISFGFFRMEAGARRYADPAIVFRLLADRSAAVQAFVVEMMVRDTATPPFGLDRFLANHDQAQVLGGDEAQLAHAALRAEYAELELSPTRPLILAEYAARLPELADAHVRYADLLAFVSTAPSLRVAIEGDPQRYRTWYAIDKKFWLSVALLNETWVDTFPLSPHDGRSFNDLWAIDQNQAMLRASGYFVVFGGPFFRLHRRMANVKFRADAAMEDNQSDPRRYWYQQRNDGTLAFGRGSLSVDPGMATGCDALVPFIFDGRDKRLADIDPATGVNLVNPQTGGDVFDRDVRDLAGLPTSEGLPMFGRATQGGTEFVFWIGRIDHAADPRPDDAEGTYAEMFDLVRAFGATDAMGTDAGGATGLIDLRLGHLTSPSRTHNGFSQTAIGFRKRSP